MDRKNGGKVLKTGRRLMGIGSVLMRIALGGIILFVLVMLGVLFLDTAAALRYPALQGPIGLVNFMLGIGYGLMGLGIVGFFLYLPGVHFLGLGQLVLNTCKKPETVQEVPPVEAVPEETAQAEEEPAEEEEETDWQALLAQDDALVPQIKTPEELVAQLPPTGNRGKRVSPALMNILRNALQQETEEALAKALQHGTTRLSKDSEKAILRYLLHTPDGDVRTASQRLYDALTKKD